MALFKYNTGDRFKPIGPIGGDYKMTIISCSYRYGTAYYDFVFDESPNKFTIKETDLLHVAIPVDLIENKKRGHRLTKIFA